MPPLPVCLVLSVQCSPLGHDKGLILGASLSVENVLKRGLIALHTKSIAATFMLVRTLVLSSSESSPKQ